MGLRVQRIGWLWWIVFVVWMAGCGEDPPPPPPECPPAPLIEAPTCAENEAAVPNGDGGLTCIPVGPEAAPTPTEPADDGGVVWVRPDASGDGSRAAPFGTVAQAYSSGASTIALMAGSHPVTSLLELVRNVRFVGAGARPAVSLQDGGRIEVLGGATVDLEGLDVRGPEGHDPVEGGRVLVDGGRTTVNLTEVRLRNVQVSVIGGAKLGVRRTEWSGGQGNQLVVRTGALAEVSDSRFSNTRGSTTPVFGVYVERACLRMTRSSVTGHGLGGIMVEQPPLASAPCPVPDGETCGAGTCDQVGLSRSSIVDNTGVGLYINGATVVAQDVHIGETLSRGEAEGNAGGEGIIVTGGGRLRLDEGATAGACGARSVIRSNASAGIRAERDASVVMRRVTVQQSSPGVSIQRAAVAVEHSRFLQNGLVGVALDEPTSAYGACNGIYDVRAVMVATPGRIFPAMPALGDGISLRPSAGGSVDLHGNTVSRNRRFGIVVSGPFAGTIRGNRGEANEYRGAVRLGTGGGRIADNTIGGRIEYTPPTALPVFSGQPVPLCSSPSDARTPCGQCLDLRSNRDHCGACANACIRGELCVAGSCTCSINKLCNGVCVDLSTDPSNCGSCGRQCTVRGQMCRDRNCLCPRGQELCRDGAQVACVDTATSASNCGRCGFMCPTGMPCTGGMCRGMPPGNDTPAGATPINMANPQTLITGIDTRAAVNNTSGSCSCTNGNDIFFNFTIPAGPRQIIYADTFGSNWDTSIFVQTGTGTNITAAGLPTGIACSDDALLAGCTEPGTPVVSRSQIMLLLNPGAYRLVISGCGGGGTTTNLRFHHLPVGNGAVTALNAGASTPGGATSGTGVVAQGCGGGTRDTSPENTYYWHTCLATAAGNLTASTCGRATWDTVLEQRSASRTANVCSDNVGGTCGIRSSVTAAIPAGPGLHTLYIDGFGGQSGAYTIAVTRP